MSARYSSKCMIVHNREHSHGMKLGGTAEVYVTPVLSDDRTGVSYCGILEIQVQQVY